MRPYPLHQYTPWQPPPGLDAFQEALVLSAYPAGSRIAAARSYRPDYLLYPLRFSIQTAAGSTQHCALKISYFTGGIEREARVLSLLARLGLPVPVVLAGPVTHPAHPQAGPLLVLGELPGQPLP